MPALRPMLAALLLGALVAAGCSHEQPPRPAQPATGQTAPAKNHPELTAPLEGCLTALRDMNAAGKAKDIAGAQAQFQAFRTYWATAKAALDPVDPKLAKHIEDGAVELDNEFTKPADQFRFYELDEETVKLGRLLSQGAALLQAPIRADLVQKDPSLDVPFNKEQTIAVTLTEHKISPDIMTVDQHTKVTFVVTNRGKESHQFILEHYAVAMDELKPGETQQVTLVLLDAGEFETACHMPGHYEVGMHGTVKVLPAELQKK